MMAGVSVPGGSGVRRGQVCHARRLDSPSVVSPSNGDILSPFSTIPHSQRNQRKEDREWLRKEERLRSMGSKWVSEQMKNEGQS